MVVTRTSTEMGKVQHFGRTDKTPDPVSSGKREPHDKLIIKDGSAIEVCRLAVIASMRLRRKKIGQMLVQKVFQVGNFKIKVFQVANFKSLPIYLLAGWASARA